MAISKEIEKFINAKKNLPDFVSEFLDHKIYTEGKKVSTILGYIFEIQLFLEWSNVQTLDDISRVSKVQISKFVQFRTQNTSSKATVARSTAAVKSLFKYLYQFEHIPANPTEAVKVPLPKPKPIHIIKPLSTEEITYLLHSIKEGIPNENDKLTFEEMVVTGKGKGKGLTDRQKAWNGYVAYRDYTIALLLFSTGLRVSELEGLNLNDYSPSNFADGLMVLGSLKVKRKGKTKEETQPVYLNQEMEAVLHTYIQKYRIHPKKEQEAMFTDIKGNGRFTKRGIQQMIKKYALTFLGRSDFSVHKCRHSAAQNLYNATNDIYLVSKFLSHSDVKTSQRYAQHTDQQLMYAANMLSLQSQENKDDKQEANNEEEELSIYNASNENIFKFSLEDDDEVDLDDTVEMEEN